MAKRKNIDRLFYDHLNPRFLKLGLESQGEEIQKRNLNFSK